MCVCLFFSQNWQLSLSVCLSLSILQVAPLSLPTLRVTSVGLSLSILSISHLSFPLSLSLYQHSRLPLSVRLILFPSNTLSCLCLFASLSEYFKLPPPSLSLSLSLSIYLSIYLSFYLFPNSPSYLCLSACLSILWVAYFFLSFFPNTLGVSYLSLTWKEYSTLHRASEMEPNHRILFSFIPKTPLWGRAGFTTTVCVFKQPSAGRNGLSSNDFGSVLSHEKSLKDLKEFKEREF